MTLEQRFRRAETEPDSQVQNEIARGYNITGLWCIFLCAAGLLCLGWRMDWRFW